MPSIQAKREQRSTLASETRALMDANPGDKWGDEQQQKYDGLVAQIERIDGEISREQKVLDIEAAQKHKVRDRASRDNISDDEAEHRLSGDKQVFRAWLAGGVDNLTREQREVVAERREALRNTMGTGTGSEGGFLVPNEFSANLLAALKDYGGMRSVAQVIRTETGAAMDFPTTDATSEEGEIVGENAPTTNEDASFGTMAHVVYKFSSKDIAVPFELLQDSAIDIEAHLRDRLNERLGRITNRLFTTGTGANQPHGAVTGSAAGKIGATGQTSIITWEDLIDLVHSVDPAYRRSASCSLMFHDNTLRELKKLKDNDGRPLWLPGIDVAEPATIAGQRYTINQDMPVMAAGAKSVLFGDFNRYLIRDVMQVALFRMTDSAYTKKGQVGFLAFMRSGGRLMDVGGALKHYQNAAS
ncbi:phage major capsid protein [Pseudomonas sp. Choline-3u-10]|uniref:Putative capsid protein n=3 Tax=viral metagenome TaxID=1070528 RepID=A0A6M3XAN0_9ZZZZ|nr:MULTISPECIES: phage major capsid protein [Pseudomonadaceae]MBK3797531.1 phage major capsid protein [Stutzerimonas stutzeri]MBK3876370.1 phage major capsid protein [Stutzerimonas stutzeri]PKG90922.1 phage major capsid protein [Pseudomonas sp. Choline-3u-10]